MTQLVSPGPTPRSVRTPAGQVLQAPPDWTLLPPGDAALTRRVKESCPTWTVQEKVGRRTFSRGVWAPAAIIHRVREQLTAERSTPEYARKRESDTRRREAKQTEYVEDFRQAVLDFLAFSPRHATLANRLADEVATHATPVGSGTVAGTQRIPIQERAEAAVIAWMRHRTTAYDHTPIPRIKGKRREVRRQLAARSRALLEAYRTNRPTDPNTCPLQRALTTRAA